MIKVCVSTSLAWGLDWINALYIKSIRICLMKSWLFFSFLFFSCLLLPPFCLLVFTYCYHIFLSLPFFSLLFVFVFLFFFSFFLCFYFTGFLFLCCLVLLGVEGKSKRQRLMKRLVSTLFWFCFFSVFYFGIPLLGGYGDFRIWVFELWRLFLGIAFSYLTDW